MLPDNKISGFYRVTCSIIHRIDKFVNTYKDVASVKRQLQRLLLFFFFSLQEILRSIP